VDKKRREEKRRGGNAETWQNATFVSPLAAFETDQLMSSEALFEMLTN
jgi:hypothetical protein